MGGEKKRQSAAPVAQPEATKLATKSKHYSYLEVVENVNKKNPLDVQYTQDLTPPPGYAFLGIGKPELTQACRDMSRARGAMVFIVSTAKTVGAEHLSQQIHRVGHHFREAILEEAEMALNIARHESIPQSGEVDISSIPDSEHRAQADAAIRDLFPRIPHPDRQMIIDTSFTRRPDFKLPVGLSLDVPLSRRVQLAVLAHIRHAHTNYDELLKDGVTEWRDARKLVQVPCLDTLVKWRGDDETGRDQLDDFIKEVVVISDSSSSESDSEDDPASSGSRLNRRAQQAVARTQRNTKTFQSVTVQDIIKRRQRGFRRYNAAWKDAIRRSGDLDEPMADVSQQPSLPPDALQNMLVRSVEDYSGYSRSFTARGFPQQPSSNLPQLQPISAGPYNSQLYRQNNLVEHNRHFLKPIWTESDSSPLSSSLPVDGFRERMRRKSNSPGRPPAKRIMVNAARPGGQPGQIVMEDRGGFYARVSPERAPLPRVLVPLERSALVPRHNHQAAPLDYETEQWVEDATALDPEAEHYRSADLYGSERVRLVQSSTHLRRDAAFHTPAHGPELQLSQPVFYRILRQGESQTAVPQYADDREGSHPNNPMSLD